MPGTAAISKAELNASVTDPAGNPSDRRHVYRRWHLRRRRQIGFGPRHRQRSDRRAGAQRHRRCAVGRRRAAKSDRRWHSECTDKTLALTHMEASWKQQALKLLAPAKLNFVDGVAMDRLRLGFRQAELTVSGKAGSTLDLTATLRNLPADIGAIANPAFAADGVIAADARLTGTPARPEGTIKLTATGVRQRQGPGQALPAANLLANATLLGTTARIDTKLTAGPSHLGVTGSVPLASSGRSGPENERPCRSDNAGPAPDGAGPSRSGRGDLGRRRDRHHHRAAGPRHRQPEQGRLHGLRLGAHVSNLDGYHPGRGRHHPSGQFHRKGRPRDGRRLRHDQSGRRDAGRSAFHRRQRPPAVE